MSPTIGWLGWFSFCRRAGPITDRHAAVLIALIPIKTWSRRSAVSIFYRRGCPISDIAVTKSLPVLITTQIRSSSGCTDSLGRLTATHIYRFFRPGLFRKLPMHAHPHRQCNQKIFFVSSFAFRHSIFTHKSAELIMAGPENHITFPTHEITAVRWTRLPRATG